ncbi:hypothetical protein [Luteolibacter luteus]|uniref:Uncharacterized protein n=1 Tax=Luteolibacter luteus TaxID=2728835 RepID=A0A858RJ90_9BACT|nr:hypothetical protein [Luteolibacter luteus]QJE96548.1 hypothetical protein HHL09_12400 [Luteolibacter luteus]
MGIVSLILGMVILVLIGVGIAMGLVACAIAALLIATGVISASVIVGIRNGRPADGIRFFFLLCGVLAGVPSGAVCGLLFHRLYLAAGDDLMILIGGGLAGGIAGILMGLSLDFISRRGHEWALAKLAARSPSSPA